MSLEIWAAFALASTILLIIPGPTILLVVSYALGAGRATAVWTVIGVFFGDLVAMTLSVIGLGAILAASATAFFVLKVTGGLYLIWLGWKLWTAPMTAEKIEGRSATTSGPKMAFHAFAVTVTNPKGIVFFIAFVPQFLDANAPAAPQLAIMVATFTGLAVINALIYALAASELRERIKRPSVMRWMNRAGGGALMAMGAATLLARRT
ncbi:MAG: LysE family translocator [Pseudomonadota bacterium]